MQSTAKRRILRGKSTQPPYTPPTPPTVGVILRFSDIAIGTWFRLGSDDNDGWQSETMYEKVGAVKCSVEGLVSRAYFMGPGAIVVPVASPDSQPLATP